MNKELLDKYKYKPNKIINDSLFGLPTELKNVGNLYPIKVKDYQEFNEEYGSLLLLNHDYLNIKKDESLINALVVMSAYQDAAKKQKEKVTEGGKFASRLILDPLKQMEMMEKGESNNNDKEVKLDVKISQEDIVNALNKFASMLSVLLRKDVVISSRILGFEIWNEDRTSCSIIQEEDFLLLREIVLLQNGLVEPIKYHDALVEEWMNKAKDARRNKDVTFNDLIVIVKNSTGKKYEEIGDMNMLQFYSDYSWVNHKNDYDAATLFKTVSNKVPNIPFSTGIISKLFKNTDSNLFIEMDKVTDKLD